MKKKGLTIYLLLVLALFLGYAGYKVQNRIANRMPPAWQQDREELAPPAGLSWTHCARDGEQCTFEGTMRVRYGADGTYTYRTATGFIDCTAPTFGKAGAEGSQSCEYAPTPDFASQPPADENSVIAIENRRPGTSDWRLRSPARSGEIEGYASLSSVAAGGSIDFLVHTEAPSYNIDIFRMGYYGGSGARLMASYANLPGIRQQKPCVRPDGIIECNWKSGHTLTVPAAKPGTDGHWTSGIYLAKLTTNDKARKDSYIIFVVRDDSRAARYTAQLPDTTYQAYNVWGGKSLYAGCPDHDYAWACPDGTRPPHMVSFNRPYGPSANPVAAYGVGAGEFLTNVQPVTQGYPITSSGFDYNMVRWMERRGYDVEYISNLDLHGRADTLKGTSAFISMGHDEYYSSVMRDRVVEARDAGVNLAFFSSNQVYWQVRFAEGAHGDKSQQRMMICYKYSPDPETRPELTTGTFRSLGQDEASFMGAQYVFDPVIGGITLTNPGHWLFAGSGAGSSTVLRGLLGYEINRIIPGISPSNVISLARTRVGPHTSDMSYYIADSGAQVFGTGSMQWSWGLDDYISNGVRPDYRSTIAQRITDNVFRAVGEQDLYTLQAGNSGLHLQAPAAQAPVQPAGTSTDSASRAVQWRLLTTHDGSTRVVARSTGRCLDAFGARAGSQAMLRECDGLADQQWRLRDLGDGLLAIGTAGGNLCLASPAGDKQAESALRLEACDGSASQRWKRSPLPPAGTSAQAAA